MYDTQMSGNGLELKVGTDEMNGTEWNGRAARRDFVPLLGPPLQL